MKYKLLVSFLVVFAIISCKTLAVDKKSEQKADKKLLKKVQLSCVAFYNLENLFDTINQSNNDEEFLPDGANKWTGMKLLIVIGLVDGIKKVFEIVKSHTTKLYFFE